MLQRLTIDPAVFDEPEILAAGGAVLGYFRSLIYCDEIGMDRFPACDTSLLCSDVEVDVLTANSLWGWSVGGEFVVPVVHPGISIVRPVFRRIPFTAAERSETLDWHGRSCGQCGSQHHLQIDHIWPVSRGGTNDPDNLQVLCRSCNASKGASV